MNINKEPKKRKLIEKWKNMYDDSLLQNKMDMDNILYCEGEHKPSCRGYLHWIPFIAFTIVFFKLIQICKTTKEIFFVSMWSLINIITFKISIILHTYELNPIQEIWFQKLDHIMVYINTFNHIIQIIFLYNYKDISLLYSYFIFLITIISTLFGIYLVLSCKKKDYQLFFASIPVFLCIPLILNHFSSKQKTYFFSIWFGILFGIITYNLKIPISDIFGYHEIFHFFTIISAIFSIMLQKSLLENNQQSTINNQQSTINNK